MTATARTLEQQAELMRKALADVGLDPNRVNLEDDDLGVYRNNDPDLPEDHLLIWKAFRLVDPEGTTECYDCWSASSLSAEATCPAHTK